MIRASALASSVLPTPVGPRKMKDPSGRRGSLSPILPRRIALATASTALSCPIMRSFKILSKFSSFLLSSLSSCFTGIPVHEVTISAMLSFVTTSALPSLDFCHAVFSSSSFLRNACSSSRNRAASSKFCALMASSLLFESSSMVFSMFFISGGEVKLEIRMREAASSTRSMALSGRYRSLIYRFERLTAASSASSEIFSLWCASYLSRRPFRIKIASSGVGSPTRTD